MLEIGRHLQHSQRATYSIFWIIKKDIYKIIFKKMHLHCDLLYLKILFSAFFDFPIFVTISWLLINQYQGFHLTRRSARRSEGSV